jgi:hypothetical protein
VGSKFQEAYEEMEGSKAVEEEAIRQEFAEAWEASKKAGAQKLLKLKATMKTAHLTTKLLAGAKRGQEGHKDENDGELKEVKTPPKPKKAPKVGLFRSIPKLRTKLRELQEMPEVSASARQQIRGIFALFEQVDRIETEAASLRIPDMALQTTIKREFNALMRVCETREAGLNKKGKVHKEVQKEKASVV